MNDWSDEETDDPHYADRRNFYKVEKWLRHIASGRAVENHCQTTILPLIYRHISP
jgi:hypothetical protein